jgi:hypothetical protein
MAMKSLSRKERSNKIAPGHYIHPKREINRTGRNLPALDSVKTVVGRRSQRDGKALFN